MFSDQEQKKVIRFEVAGKPVPKKRPRVTSRGTYTPKETVSYERSIAWAAKAAVGCMAPTDKQCSVSLSFYETKADIDNLIKSALDGMNGVIFIDDRQVHHVEASRLTGEPKTVVEVIINGS